MKRALLAWLVCLFACERPVVKEGALFEGARLAQPRGYLLSPRAPGDYELVSESKGENIEKVSYAAFDARELSLPLDSLATVAFGDSLLKTYGRALKRKMGVFGGLMKSYFEYFDKFQTLSLSSLERNGARWFSLLKKHVDEPHYWQSFYAARDGRLVFITLFYAQGDGEPPIPTSDLAKFIDVVRFDSNDSLSFRKP
ncbi:MAG: hypothetical protein NZM06_09440 [Chloroherpetonaceae bacterium]|nr:hypothetical protein [Chloroherpetonaceae bacterium]MDW8437280.1 hypothetical protein [Chloroherpetonaceae bacterium]